ncbi:GL23520 [Drosophila persimilis]|uniref:GL23520 n=1 Tax=Drosophila persimilis TaxID=7234 RepID=B4G2Z6_DROPE|nr:RNA-binding protein 34 [Drosophila persimilis]EDW24191.1 GL23520 [Drosophila persimilis]
MKTPRQTETVQGELKPLKKQPVVSQESKLIKKKGKKPKQLKTEKAAVNKAVDNESPKKLTVADLAKIEKKRAKKEGQKLRKQQQKLLKASAGPTETEVKKEINSVEKESEEETEKLTTNTVVKQETKQQKKASKKSKANNKDEGAAKWERDPAQEAATVFVGNLPINTKRVQLVRLLKPYGNVKSIRLRTAGGKQLFKHKQRKGAGSLNAYVVLDSAEIAERALALNGTEFKENHLRVTPAAKSESGDDKGPKDADAKRTIFVGSLKYSATEEKLREIFSSCGEIEYIRCLQEGEKGCKGVAYVCFKTPDAVGLALELNQTLLDDRPINVERYLVKKLGAKRVRDAAAAKSGPPLKSKTKQNSVGAKKRLDKKQYKQNGKPTAALGDKTAAGSKKKSEYRGVKVDGIKKAKKPKKKSNDQLHAMAKKIAPKPKT